MIIGQTIYELRKAQGLTQENLASSIGVSAQAASKRKSGGTPDIELLPRLADFFGITLDTLFGRDVNYRNLKTEFLKALADLPEEKRFAKAFDFCWLIENGIMGNTDLTRWTPDEVLENLEEPYEGRMHTEVLWNSGITKMALRKDLRYFLIMPEPPGGWREELAYKDSYTDLFAFFSDRYLLKVLFFLYERDNKPFTPRLIEKVLGVDKDGANKVLEGLLHYNFLSTSTIELDDEVRTVYHFDPNPAFIGLLAMCEDLLIKPGAFAGAWHGRSKPYLIKTP